MKTKTKLATAISVAVYVALAIPAAAQDKPDKLTLMGEIYKKEVEKIRLPILEKLAKDLTALEQELTKGNQLEKAVKARDERKKIETEIASIKRASGRAVASGGGKKAKEEEPEKPDERTTFTIPMGNAQLEGRTKRSSGGVLTNWVTTTCKATWRGGKIIPGYYDVYIDYSSPYSRMGGELLFHELHQDFNCIIRPAQHRQQMKVGTFKLGTGLGFSIQAKTKNPSGIFHLYGIQFKPSKQQ